MLHSISITPEGDVRAGCKYTIQYRGTTEPEKSTFVLDKTAIDELDVLDQIESDLVENAVEWGIVDDITP